MPGWAVELLVKIERHEAITTAKLDALQALITPRLDDLSNSVGDLDQRVTTIEQERAEERGAAKRTNALWTIGLALWGVVTAAIGLFGPKVG